VAALWLRMSLLDELSNESAMRTLGSAMLWSAGLALGVWAAWVGGGHGWTRENKARWSARMHCVEREDMQHGGEFTICRSVFVLWVSPLIVSAINALLAAVLYALGSSFQRVKPWKLLQLQRHRLGAAGRKLGAGALVSGVLGDMKLRQEKQRRAKNAHNSLKALGYMLLALTLLLYAVARLAGSGMLATQGLYSIIGTAFLGVVVVWVGVQYTGGRA
jgi:hypothetical protein